jgi:hypothetical protein
LEACHKITLERKKKVMFIKIILNRYVAICICKFYIYICIYCQLYI